MSLEGIEMMEVGKKMWAQADILKSQHRIFDVGGTEMRRKNARNLVGCE